ncbi:MAG: hypothetical protein ACI9EF_001343 [Pseudohongiellaceae bacterium]|jgi:hypothetical protein
MSPRLRRWIGETSSTNCGTSACDGPLAIGVTAPPGQAFSVTSVHAPPNASGFLVLGLAADAMGTPVLGINLHVDLTSLNVIIPVTANEGGYTAFPIPFGSGLQIVGQYVWINTSECGHGSTLSSTNAIAITIP